MIQCTITPPEPLYSSFGGDPDLGELVDLFVSNIPQRIDQLLADVAGGNWSEVQRTAHQLKGAAGSYGFPQITFAAAALETSLLEGEPEMRLLRELHELLDLCGRARSGPPR